MNAARHPNAGADESGGAEEKLRASYKEISDLKAALDEHAIVAITDPQWKITYVNDKFCAISKFAREELIGQDHRIINSGWHPKELIRGLWTTIAHGKVWKGELKNKAKDGSFYWVDTTIVPFLDEQGKPRQYVAIRADITERKRAEEAAAHLAAIVEFSDDAIIGKDLQGIVTSWNTGAEWLFGYSAAEMIGQPIMRLIPPDRAQEEVEILGRVRQGESVKHFDTERSRKDGRLIPISVTVSPIKDSNGTIIGASKVARDITERKKAEQWLATSLKEVSDFKTALDEHAIVAMTNPKGKITYVNDKFCAISKYSREELMGQDHRIINSGFHPKEFIRDLWTTIARGKVWHGEIKNKAKDGTFYWVDTTIVPFLDDEGHPRQYVAIRADITHRKGAEVNLAVSLKEVSDFKTALDEHAIVAITDSQGKISYVNDKFCAISKFSREELLGQDHRIINSGWHPKEFIRHLWTTIEHGKVWKGELKNKAKDGSFYWVDTTIVPFLNPDGKPRQYVAIRADVTERKRVEEALRESHENLERNVAERTAQLQQAKDHAEAAGRAKSEFMASMSHELRTPLNGIIGFSEFLVDGKPGALNPKQKEYLQDILNSGRHLLQLINDVLDLSKVEAGKLEFIPEPFSLGKAVGEVCSVAGPIGQKKRIQVSVGIAPGLDQVTLDQMKFKQVIFNLLSNALKFTDSGGRVEIRCEPNGLHQFSLAVTDSGIGIKPEDLPRLFKEFEQIESGAARRYEGTGLGLALTRKIVEMQGGCITVVSEVGRGSTFTVTLPLAFRKEPA